MRKSTRLLITGLLMMRLLIMRLLICKYKNPPFWKITVWWTYVTGWIQWIIWWIIWRILTQSLCRRFITFTIFQSGHFFLETVFFFWKNYYYISVFCALNNFIKRPLCQNTMLSGVTHRAIIFILLLITTSLSQCESWLIQTFYIFFLSAW